MGVLKYGTGLHGYGQSDPIQRIETEPVGRNPKILVLLSKLSLFAHTSLVLVFRIVLTTEAAQ